jgi:hypothetical protein
MTILSRVAGFMGWNPIGTSVTVRVDESSNPSIVGAELTAVIASTHDDGTFVLRLTTPLLQGERSLQEVTAYQRSKGFGVYHMAFGAIPVYLSPREGNASDQRFASALVKRYRP